MNLLVNGVAQPAGHYQNVSLIESANNSVTAVFSNGIAVTVKGQLGQLSVVIAGV